MTALLSGTLTELVETGLRELDPNEDKCLEQSVVADPGHERMPPILRDRATGRILDGKRQLFHRTKHGLKANIVDVDCTDDWEQLQLMLEIQVGRRNLKPKELAMCFATLRQIAGRFDASADAYLPVKAAAKKSGVSEKTMKLTNRVLAKGAAVIVEGVQEDLFAVSDAAGIVDLAHDDQVRIAEVAKQLRITLKKAREQVMPKATTGDDSPAGQASETLQQLVSRLNGLGLLGRVKAQVDAIEKAIADSAQPVAPQRQPQPKAVEIELEPTLV